MASERVDRVPPAVALRQEIAKHRRSVMVAASGMGPVLEILDAYIGEQDAHRAQVAAALGLLASVALKAGTFSDVQLQALTALQAWAHVEVRQ